MDEGGGLENRYMGNCIVGSNPTPSASVIGMLDARSTLCLQILGISLYLYIENI